MRVPRLHYRSQRITTHSTSEYEEAERQSKTHRAKRATPQEDLKAQCGYWDGAIVCEQRMKHKEDVSNIMSTGNSVLQAENTAWILHGFSNEISALIAQEKVQNLKYNLLPCCQL